MSNQTTVNKIWVASGPAGVVGAIHRTGEGFAIRVGHEADYHGDFPTLDVAKSALHAALGPGADRPEFTEH
ncbi:hypothetical protein GCM10025867_22030 [Frondihabitans sucicola]|uniref:Methyltransferase n=1 Tax=Frondihabitans sucicola TaxID=1268041 RepID=A0ABM8GNZ4_9MICO|nr:methyltransferase [Frondihabitans sucicola]BDZ49962.1 hypothetical protein GCM10025867_22030 [Frondihabitans sucicola]